MIVDALKSADSHLKISEKVFDPTKFMYLSDTIKDRIEESAEPVNEVDAVIVAPATNFLFQELETARQIFTRIRERDLYRCVDYKVVEWELLGIFKKFITPERIAEASRAFPQIVDASQPTLEEAAHIENDQIDMNTFHGTGPLDEPLQADDIVIDFSVMHHGMKEKNPMDNVKFYSKHCLNSPCILILPLDMTGSPRSIRLHVRRPRCLLWFDATHFRRGDAQNLYQEAQILRFDSGRLPGTVERDGSYRRRRQFGGCAARQTSHTPQY